MSRISDIDHFIACAKEAQSADELRGVMEAVTREMRFHSYSLVRHVRKFGPNPSSYAISNFPRYWIDYYLKNELRAWDPVFVATSRTAAGFSFEDIPTLFAMNNSHKRVLEEGSRIGRITGGFCVPWHLPGEITGSCTFAMRHGTPLPEANLQMAQLIGSFAQEAARQNLWPSHSMPLSPDVLTTRQLECVLLVGKGKTDLEIARILEISEETVTAHINEARRRYGVGRRAQLLVQALYRGDLDFRDLLD